ncbi:MAG: hypothetical protein JHC53_08465 [Thermoleophilia bacterium]|jgi:hypothetical protein|nr:hypothetical protein [Thermoleophilia bacterium]
MGILRRVSEKGGDSSRIKWVAGGLTIGFVWGTFMWLITGMQGDVKVWMYLALTMAMIGGGIAAIFGAMNARKKGERITPRIAPKDEAADKAAAKAARKAARGKAE